MLTVRDVLATPELQRGAPQVVAGEGQLDRIVRWVHVSELADVGHLLRGGELILTTGLGLDGRADRLRDYVEQLVAAKASGLVIELGHRFPTLPPPLIEQAAQHGLPLIALGCEVPFVDVTQVVHSRIVASNVEELRRSEEAHRTFTQLSMEGAPPTEVLHRAAVLADRPVVFENLSHQVLALGDAGRDLGAVLEDWEHRSRSAVTGPGTTYVPEAGLLVTDIGARGSTWGRLAMLLDDPPTPLATMVLERAANALTLYRLIQHEPGALELQTQGSLLDDILERSSSAAGDVAVRALALGVPLTGRTLVGLAARPTGPAAGAGAVRRLAEVISRSARRVTVPVLVGTANDREVQVLLSLGPDTDPETTISTLASDVHAAGPGDGLGPEVVIGVGAAVSDLRQAGGSLREAGQVAEGAEAVDDVRPYYRMRDVRVRGLVHLLREDPRLQAFVERELGPLLRHDREHRTQLLDVLAAYLDNGTNKSATADALHLSRPALYQRLTRIADVLDVPLEPVESRLSLHLALLGLVSIRHGTRHESAP